MDKTQNASQLQFLGNPLQSYWIALAVFFGAIFILRLAAGFAQRRLKAAAGETALKPDGFLLKTIRETAFPLLYLGAFYFAVKQLVLNAAVDKLLHSAMVVILTVQGIRLGLTLLIYFLERSSFQKREVQKENAAVSKSILTIIKTIVWGVGAVFILDNLGFNVAAVVAGLGIAGVAVALACQTILGDLFNYFVIFFDKPFREGDFIVSENLMGTIEDVGIKSTRIRALGGEEIIISNSNLAGSRIHNYKRMNQRRAEFNFRVSHATTQVQLKKIPGLVRHIIEGIEEVKFDRAHFKEIQEWGLVIEAAYYVLDADFNKYMDIQEKINLEIRESLLQGGVEFSSFKPFPYLQEAG